MPRGRAAEQMRNGFARQRWPLAAAVLSGGAVGTGGSLTDRQMLILTSVERRRQGSDLGAGRDVRDRAAAAVREWQGTVLNLVRTEGQDKRFTARVLSFGVNGLGVALMVVVFASTGGLTGAEVGIAGGTAVVGQKLLEAVFGDQAVRRLADAATKDLRARAEELLRTEAARFTDRIDVLAIDPSASGALRDAHRNVEGTRHREAGK